MGLCTATPFTKRYPRAGTSEEVGFLRTVWKSMAAPSSAHNCLGALGCFWDPLCNSFNRDLPKAMIVLDTQLSKLKKYIFFRNAYTGNKNKKSKDWLNKKLRHLSPLRGRGNF